MNTQTVSVAISDYDFDITKNNKDELTDMMGL